LLYMPFLPLVSRTPPPLVELEKPSSLNVIPPLPAPVPFLRDFESPPTHTKCRFHPCIPRFFLSLPSSFFSQSVFPLVVVRFWCVPVRSFQGPSVLQPAVFFHFYLLSSFLPLWRLFPGRGPPLSLRPIEQCFFDFAFPFVDSPGCPSLPGRFPIGNVGLLGSFPPT